MVEGGFDHFLEEVFVAGEGAAGIAGQADDGAFDFGRGDEGAFADGEEVFDVVPGLEQHRQNAIGFGAGAGSQAFGHLFLNHADHFGDLFPCVQHLKEDLRGDVIGEVADQREGRGEQPREVHLQEVCFVEVRGKFRIVRQEVADAFGVDLDYLELDRRIFQQILGQHACARTDLQHRPMAAEGSHDGMCNALVREEVLAEGLFGADGLHQRAMKCLYIRSMPPWSTLGVPSGEWWPLQMMTKPYFSSGLKNMALRRP